MGDINHSWTVLFSSTLCPGTHPLSSSRTSWTAAFPISSIRCSVSSYQARLPSIPCLFPISTFWSITTLFRKARKEEPIELSRQYKLYNRQEDKGLLHAITHLSLPVSVHSLAFHYFSASTSATASPNSRNNRVHFPAFA